MNDPIPMRPVGPHPTPEQLYQARRSPHDAVSEETLLHAAGCSVCSLEMARQDAFDAPEALPAANVEAAWQRFRKGESAPARRSGNRSFFFALAATLTVSVLGLGLWTMSQRPPEIDVERGSPAVAADWQPSGDLDAPPAAFTFPASNGGPWQVRVFNAEQTYAWTSPPAETARIEFPATEQSRLQPGVEYYWTVIGGDSTEAARSFQIRTAP